MKVKVTIRAGHKFVEKEIGCTIERVFGEDAILHRGECVVRLTENCGKHRAGDELYTYNTDLVDDNAVNYPGTEQDFAKDTLRHGGAQ